MARHAARVALLVALLLVAVGFFALDLDRELTLASLRERHGALRSHYGEHPLETLFGFAVLYVVVTGASLPGAAILTLTAGSLFGVVAGTLVVSVASTGGAVVSFLFARFLFRDAIQSRFGPRLSAVNEGMRRDGARYLLAIRLAPVLPFFVINNLMALTPIRLWTFTWVSQIGMLPATAVYVNAGTQLSQVTSLVAVLSFDVFGALILLGVFPIVSRRAFELIQAFWVLRKYPRPRRYDYDVLVIGAGAAGLSAAAFSARLRAKVGLIERGKMGGECLNTGCVPSKALLRTAKALADARRGRELGLEDSRVTYRFEAVMERVRRIIARIEPHDSAERFRGLGVDVHAGDARIASPFSVRVTSPDGQKELTARSLIVATGGDPVIPALPGLLSSDYVTTETVWDLEALPQRLVVLGGGPVGCELAQAFGRLGAAVSVVERSARLLSKEDEDAAAFVLDVLSAEGIDVFTATTADGIKRTETGPVLIYSKEGASFELPFDRILLATGRRARVAGFGLEEIGVTLSDTGNILSSDALRTSVPNVYVCGDVSGRRQLTHAAGQQGVYAALNALFSPFMTFNVDDRVLPRCIYTDPEVAHVGLTEQEAQDRSISYRVVRYDIKDLDRAITDEEAKGFIKVLTGEKNDTILGVTVVCARAGELISEYALAMRHGLGLKKILRTIHPYPTFAEATRHASAEWAKEQIPGFALSLLERYFGRRRRAARP